MAVAAIVVTNLLMGHSCQTTFFDNYHDPYKICIGHFDFAGYFLKLYPMMVPMVAAVHEIYVEIDT